MAIPTHRLHVIVVIEMNKLLKHNILALALFVLGLTPLHSQSPPALLQGIVTFKSSVNVYVKYPSTETIRVGDTLYHSKDSLIPCLVVSYISSTSCVGKNISNRLISISDLIYAKINRRQVLDSAPSAATPKALVKKTEAPVRLNPVITELTKSPMQKITGRLSMASYSSFSDKQGNDAHRLRYTLVLNAKNIQGSGWSGESYISFRHRAGEWQEVKAHLFNALKVYNLAMKYEFSQNEQIWFGRKINLNVSNIGAVDGVQYEKKIKNMTYGAILGSRPDYTDYSFNIKLMQAGIFMGHTLHNKTGDMSNTLAFLEQKNNFKTDRRFVYLQQSNTLMKNLMFFGSFELDLYKKLEGKPVSTLSPSSIYLSLRYKLNKKLAFSTSYDALKNVIYYESYKNFIDQIIEQEVRQGLRFGADFSPFTAVSIGATAGYRFQANRADPSRNADLYFSFYQVPWLNLSATVSATLLQTDYLDGNILGLRLNKSFKDGKWSVEGSFRKVNYLYSSAELPLQQNIGSLNMTFRLLKKLSLSVNYEGTFEDQRKYSSLYCNLVKRF